MAFEPLTTQIEPVGSGERWRDEGYDLTASNYERGIVAGRIVQMGADADGNPQLQPLKGDATPVLAGALLRSITNPVESGPAYTGIPEQVDYRRIGGVTLDAVTGATPPAMFAPVYAVNAAGEDSGKVQSASGGSAVAVPAEFLKVLKPGVWLIRLKDAY